MKTLNRPEQDKRNQRFSGDPWLVIWVYVENFINAKTSFAEMKQNFRKS
jgi:hypothetical protein